jgi:hypothetical protein
MAALIARRQYIASTSAVDQGVTSKDGEARFARRRNRGWFDHHSNSCCLMSVALYCGNNRCCATPPMMMGNCSADDQHECSSDSLTERAGSRLETIKLWLLHKGGYPRKAFASSRYRKGATLEPVDEHANCK